MRIWLSQVIALEFGDVLIFLYLFICFLFGIESLEFWWFYDSFRNIEHARKFVSDLITSGSTSFQGEESGRCDGSEFR